MKQRLGRRLEIANKANREADVGIAWTLILSAIVGAGQMVAPNVQHPTFSDQQPETIRFKIDYDYDSEREKSR